MWKSYKEVYEEVLQVGSALRASGAEPVRIHIHAKPVARKTCSQLNQWSEDVILIDRARRSVFTGRTAPSGLWQWRSSSNNS